MLTGFFFVQSLNFLKPRTSAFRRPTLSLVLGGRTTTSRRVQRRASLARIEADPSLDFRPPPQNLFVGSTLHTEPHFTSIEGIIPNSQVVISPPATANSSLGTNLEWKWQLFLHPGDYVPWVSAFVVLTTLALCGVVTMLHRKEKVRRVQRVLSRQTQR